jgi:hypothetical protein
MISRFCNFSDKKIQTDQSLVMLAQLAGDFGEHLAVAAPTPFTSVANSSSSRHQSRIRPVTFLLLSEEAFSEHPLCR